MRIWAYLSAVFDVGRARISKDRKALLAALEKGLVILQYRKVTAAGANRYAIATLNQSLFSYRFLGIRLPTPPGLIRYWDFGIQAWRSFYIYNIEAWAPMTL